MPESLKHSYEVLTKLVQDYDSVIMETDSFAHGQGRSIHLYLNGECVTRRYDECPQELTDLTSIFFDYFCDDYENGFESDHIIRFHMDDSGQLFADREDYASSNYYGDEVSIDPLVSEFRYYHPCDEKNVTRLSDDELDRYLDYNLEFTVAHSSTSELLIGFKATKGKKKSAVALPVKVLQIARDIQSVVMTHAEKSQDILRAVYPQYVQSWMLSGDIVELERTEYSLTVSKPLSYEDVNAIFGVNQ